MSSFVVVSSFVVACSSAEPTPFDAGASGGSPPVGGSGGAPPYGAGGSGGSSGGNPGASGGAGGTTTGGKNPPVRSAGCGKPASSPTARTGTHTITSSGKQREYTIDVPEDYDPEAPYRVIFAWHWIDSSDDAVVNGQVWNGGSIWAYYGLKNRAELAGEPAIFVAPQSRHGRWDEEDHVLFGDLLDRIEEELCVDESRVFSTGFSFGAMQTYSLSTNHGGRLRAVSALAPANFNIYLPPPSHEPIAYMSATGMSDTLTPWDGGDGRGAKYAALGHAEDNGCALPDVLPTAAPGSGTHVCYDFEGCDEGHPVRVCTFDGGHIAAHADGGTGDDGTTTWKPAATWEFFTQF